MTMPDGGSAFIGRGKFIAAIFPALLLAGCGPDHVADAGERVVYKTVNVEVPRPCPVKRPPRPAKLVRPFPTDLGALVDILLAKLKEYDGPGKYADQADAAITTCTKP